MNDKNLPLVSVVIPTYKRPDTLTRAIDSVLTQTYPNVEVIVVDDNNPDTEGRQLTEKVMAAYSNDTRVRYIRHEHNKNGSAARNTGVRNSDAKYVAFLDDDDEFLPEKIALQVERMESLSDEWAACYTCSYVEFQGKLKLDKSETREGNLLKESLKREFKSGAGSNLLIRKDAFIDLGGFDESFTRNQDYEIIVKIFTKYKISYIDTPALIIHSHVGSKTIDYDAITAQFISSFKRYIDMLPAIDQKEVYDTLNEQRFVYKFRQHKDIIGCAKMVSKGEITICKSMKLVSKGIYKFIRNRI